jgi:hypothetical protein
MSTVLVSMLNGTLDNEYCPSLTTRLFVSRQEVLVLNTLDPNVTQRQLHITETSQRRLGVLVAPKKIPKAIIAVSILFFYNTTISR